MRLIRKAFAVDRLRNSSETCFGARFFAPLILLALAACSSLPAIGGSPLPPDPDSAGPVYRDLADIPDPPAITAHSANETTIGTLTDDRAKTAQAAQDLRRQTFMQPDSNTQPGF